MTDWSERLGPIGGADAKARHARDGIVSALGRLEHSERDSVDGLREAICAFVGVLVAEGAMREEAMDAVRALVGAPATPEGAYVLVPAVRDALVELASHWCADEYERASERGSKSEG